MAQEGGLRTILALLLVSTSLIAAACDSSKPADSPQIPAPTLAPSQALPTLPVTTAGAASSSALPSVGPATTTAPGPTADPTAPPTPSPADTPTPTASVDASAVAAIDAADLTDDASLEAIDELRLTPEGRDAARAVLERGPGNASQAWAALIVYAGTGNDPAPVRPFATNANQSVAVLAAAILVAFGDSTGFATLGQSLTNVQVLAGSHPPMLIGDFALHSLERYVRGGNVPQVGPETSVDGYLADWAAWLDTHAAGLAFDSSTGTWTAP